MIAVEAIAIEPLQVQKGAAKGDTARAVVACSGIAVQLIVVEAEQ